MRQPFKNNYYKMFQDLFETSIIAQLTKTPRMKSALQSLLKEESPVAILELLKVYDIYALDISSKPVPIWAYFKSNNSSRMECTLDEVELSDDFLGGEDLSKHIYLLSSYFGISPTRIGIHSSTPHIPQMALPSWVVKAGPIWQILHVQQNRRLPIALYHESLNKIQELTWK